MTTLKILDQIELALRNSFRIPFTGLALVDVERLLSTIEKLRHSFPEEVKQARYLTQENKRIIQEAQEKAEAILAEAEQTVEKKIAESEILRIARERADEMIKRAKQVALEIQDGASEYAKGVLSGLEAELERLTAVVRNAKQRLNHRAVAESRGNSAQELTTLG
jgi:cell division septum initiation protein DivIVA